jgi:tetratricopeptide (TPR) repeat protein
MALLSTGRYDEAIEHFQNAHQMAPNNPMPLALLREAFHGKGLYLEAFETEIKWAAAKQDLELKDALEQGYEEAGYVGACRRGAETLVARSDSTKADQTKIVDYYAAAGQKQAALDWLERAVEDHNSIAPEIGLWATTASLRDDPRFEELLRRMKFPEDVIARTLNARQ